MGGLDDNPFIIISVKYQYYSFGEKLYKLYTIKDTVSVSPTFFGSDIEETATTILRNKYERTIDKDLGVIVAVMNIRDVSNGHIQPGDPATHHDVTFDTLAFSLEVDEVLSGEVSEIMEFGCFVRIGPLEGLVHLSQITNDFVSHDRKSEAFVSKNTGKTVRKGDIVYSKVSTISMKSNIKDTKIALTMRPEGLGKPEWITAKPKEQKRPMGRRQRR